MLMILVLAVVLRIQIKCHLGTLGGAFGILLPNSSLTHPRASPKMI
jgi:hypothetical protein